MRITDEGKSNLVGMVALKRHILTTLLRGSTNILALTKTIRNDYDEYRFIENKIFVSHIAELVKMDMVAYE